MPIKRAGALPAVDPTEDANEETFDLQSTYWGGDGYKDTIGNGSTVISDSITTSVRCMIIIVTSVVVANVAQAMQIKRGGVDKTTETSISGTHFGVMNQRCHLQYALEVLDAGTYQYDLINTSGGNITIYGASMKIIAIT